MSDVIVVGGGVIGLSIAYACAGRGARVTLLERGRLATEASGGTAGLLTAAAEGAVAGPYLELSRRSRQLFPEWNAQLESDSGISTDLRATPLLRPTVNEEEALILERWFRARTDNHSNEQLVSGAEVRDLEPTLSNGIHSAIYSPTEYQINPGRLTAALAAAVVRLNGRVCEGVEAAGLLMDGRRVIGVRTLSGKVVGGHVVLATGAWAALAGAWLGVRVPAFPLKGQLLAVRPSGRQLRTVVVTNRGYMVPKPDGTVVVGATNERCGFDRRVTLAGIEQLMDVARLSAEIQTASLEYTWAGLRPGSPDGMPILGPVPGWEGVSLAVGHTRHGVLLSGATGRMMAAHIEGTETELPISPFRVDRFAKAEQDS